MLFPSGLPLSLSTKTSALLLVLGVLAGLLSIPQNVRAQTKSFPDAWFFPNDRAKLKALEGKPPPELKLQAWIGDQVRISEQKGKVVVIDFWATWCGPCMAAIPENVELMKKYKDQGLVFLGVHDANSGWERAQGVVDQKKINYSVARDADGGVSAKAFNLSFWPTYVIIDRAGIVRGAGFIPGHVKDAVKILLAEPAPNMPAGAAGGKGEFPADWYYGGNSRAAAMKATEGKAMPALAATKWSGEALTPEAMKDRVVVLHFLASGNPASIQQGIALAALEKEMGPQGVVVVAIAPADDAWEPLAKLVEAGKLPSRLCMDAASKDAESAGKKKKDMARGETSGAYGVRYMPATVVIDRMGKVRAAGVKINKVKEIASKLLAENTAKAAGGGDDSKK
jgi:thiol-disulfide isomerase/thioredoxin